MQQLLLAFVTGLFSQPAGAPAAPPIAPAAIVAKKAQAEAPVAPPVSPDAARSARAQVRHSVDVTGSRRRHSFTFPDGSTVEFTQRARRSRDQARRQWVLSYPGTHTAGNEPDTTFEAAGQSAGLSPAAVRALRFVSGHEGGFDAINTWDVARFSWGFIQFAGGYGFPPALLHVKQSSPELFHELLAQYGVDVVRSRDGDPTPVFVSARTGRTLRGREAEQAFGDDPLAIALFIRAGRHTEIKQRQVEAAVHNYAAPALQTALDGIALAQMLGSPQGLAVLMDRQVQEGNVRRIAAALESVRQSHRLENAQDVAAREGEVLDRAIQDADARVRIRELSRSAAAALSRAAAKARGGEAGYVPYGPTLSSALDAVRQMHFEAGNRMTLSKKRERIYGGLSEVLTVTDPGRLQGLSGREMARRLERAAGEVRELASGFRWEENIRDRLRSIRSSELAGPAPSGIVLQ